MQKSNTLPPSKDDRVWRDLDQASLDHAYDQQQHAPNMSTVIRRFSSLSDSTRRAVGPSERFTYGADPAEGLDFYRASAVNAPIHVFVHGGGWRGGRASDFAFVTSANAR